MTDYRVYARLEKSYPRWWWWLVEHHLTWPSREKWLADVESGVRRIADSRGGTLVTAPVASVVIVDGRVVIQAEAWATGPAGLQDIVDVPRVDVVDRPRCPRCGSVSVDLMWAAWNSSDFDSWACRTCDNRWAGEQGR